MATVCADEMEVPETTRPRTADLKILGAQFL
jgi:hypothetical protein